MRAQLRFHQLVFPLKIWFHEIQQFKDFMEASTGFGASWKRKNARGWNLDGHTEPDGIAIRRFVALPRGERGKTGDPSRPPNRAGKMPGFERQFCFPGREISRGNIGRKIEDLTGNN